MSPLERTLAGFTCAVAIALAARRARMLSRSGAWGAVVTGSLAAAAGWAWCALLLAFFLSSSLLSAWRRKRKAHRTRAIVAKGGERDLAQVIANGGVFAIAAAGAVVTHADAWLALGAGALASAAADTWATEIGTGGEHTPRLVGSWRAVPPGTSGAVSVPGTIGLLAGAMFMGLVAFQFGLTASLAAAVVAGGVAGAMVDTLIGATIQERRWCAHCAVPTERRVHTCGATTTVRGGVPGLTNDAVNLTSCLVGGIVAVWWARAAG